MFKDRTDAGRRLAERLTERGVEADIVLAIPRGALPIGRIVADALSVPLDIIVAQKMGAPGNPEFAIGAVASDGTVWRNDEAISMLDIDEQYIEREREREAENAREKVERYRSGRDAPDLSGKRVIVVDDGVATGSTAIACLRQVREAGAAHVTLAVPVASPSSLDQLEQEADDVIVVETPSYFSAVGQFYKSFRQVSDEKAIELLEQAR